MNWRRGIRVHGVNNMNIATFSEILRSTRSHESKSVTLLVFDEPQEWVKEYTYRNTLKFIFSRDFGEYRARWEMRRR
jgi:hypothetical protein